MAYHKGPTRIGWIRSRVRSADRKLKALQENHKNMGSISGEEWSQVLFLVRDALRMAEAAEQHTREGKEKDRKCPDCGDQRVLTTAPEHGYGASEHFFCPSCKRFDFNRKEAERKEL